MEENQNQQPKQREFRGLYKHVKIPVKALDAIIIVCVVVILAVFALEMRNPGFTVIFNSKGGTDVPAQNQMYGELLELPDSPTREGYTFTGWHKDYACFEPWDSATDKITTDITLYAGWEKAS